MGIVWLVKGKLQGLDGISFFTLLLIVCPPGLEFRTGRVAGRGDSLWEILVTTREVVEGV